MASPDVHSSRNATKDSLSSVQIGRVIKLNLYAHYLALSLLEEIVSAFPAMSPLPERYYVKIEKLSSTHLHQLRL